MIFKSIFYIMKFHNSNHKLGMIHKFNNTQGIKISFKYPIHEQNFIQQIYRIIDFKIITN
jgi:hypothetical protein